MNHEILMDEASGVLNLVINRPQRKNALTHEMYKRLAEAFERAASDPSIRVVTLSGVPEVFSAGNDMADFLKMGGGVTESGLRDQPVFRFLMAIKDCPKPVIAAVCGPAVGIGTTLLLHCDHVIAGRNASFSTPFVSLGLCSEAGASVLLPMLVGHQVAKGMLMRGESLTAEQALKHGLVTELVDVPDVQATLAKRAEHWRALPSQALQATKLLMKRSTTDIQSVMSAEAEAFARLLAGDAAREAFTAFLAKRKPDFSRC